MANTYTLIASNTLGSSAASVTFSSIPQTYTDLVLKVSAAGFFDLSMYFNGTNSATLYSVTSLYGTNATAYSDRATSYYKVIADLNPDTGTTAFGSGEIYIPSYTASQNKPISADGAGEANSALTPTRSARAMLWRSTSAVTSITLTGGSYNFASGSSFFLYGVKNT